MEGKYGIINDIAQSRRHNNRLVYSCLAVIVIVFGMATYYVMRADQRAKNNAYLLHGGQRLPMAPIRDVKENLQILCEGHLYNFHELFFSLEPNLKLIKRDIEGKALHMVDWSGNRLYARLVEKKYFHDVAMRDYRYFVELDSIHIDYGTYPFPFTFYGKQAIEKGKSTTYRNLITRGQLKKSGVTPNNLNGIKIIDFQVVDNSDLERM
ncbi:hypothetical protein PP182_09150 [Maribacter sp. PR1]|uniref:Conjugative transposon protein TraK n=1 Tax=Maribacter cobaltidurans TaxID=1178778 RepID=A0ABU7ITD4_9FLAO|nr:MULTISPECIES: hypothetical protein [Maribacter]MDC6388847.1 hypothetical protein [Maribacter sp. PR1]MEE1976236.1 hypothetical protein [Maribacter cobaltidurans]